MRIVLTLLVCFNAAIPGISQTVVIRGARVIDGTGAPARNVNVVISGSKIQAVGEKITIPENAKVIDGTGQTLLPGFFDLHTHLNSSAAPRDSVSGDLGKVLKAYLACGVTSVVDFGPYGESIAPLRKLMQAGVLPSPRVTMASFVSTPHGHGTEYGNYGTTEVISAEQAHLRMKQVLAWKPDGIKALTDGWRYGSAPNQTSMNLQTLAAVVEEAHAAGIKVFSHTVTLEGAKIAAKAGVDIIVHGINDKPVDDEVIALLKEKGTHYSFTLSVYEPRDPGIPTPFLASLLEPAVQRSLQPRPGQAPSFRGSPEARKIRFDSLKKNVMRLFDAGVPMVVGTDAGCRRHISRLGRDA